MQVDGGLQVENLGAEGVLRETDSGRRHVAAGPFPRVRIIPFLSSPIPGYASRNIVSTDRPRTVAM